MRPGKSTPPRTLGMVRALAAHLDDQAIVIDVLRWTDEYPSAHQAGGTRDTSVLLNRLTLVGTLSGDRRAILIDDVVASGGHLRAAAAFLMSRGCAVAGAICAGRADDELIGEDAFAARVETFADFELG